MPLTYADIRRQQQTANPWLQSLSPEDYSRVMAQITGAPQEYASGVDPSWLAQADYYINRGIEATGLPEAAGQLGEAAFGETGRQVFEGIPRAVVNMAPMAIPGAGQGLTLARLAALGGTAALTGLETYGATEKPLPSILSATLAGATPAIMNKAGGMAIQAMKAPEDAVQAATLRAMQAEIPAATTNAGEVLRRATLGDHILAHTTAPTTTGQVLAGIGAGQGALTAAQTGIEAVNIGADPDRSYRELLDPSYWAAQAIAQGVFGGLDVARLPGQLRGANRMRGMLTSGDTRTVLGPSSPLEQQPRMERQATGRVIEPEGPVYGPEPDQRLALYVQNLVSGAPEAAAAPAGPMVTPELPGLETAVGGAPEATVEPLVKTPRPPMPPEEVATKAMDPDPLVKAEAVATLPPDVQRALQMARDADIENGSTPEEATLAAVNRGAAMIADAEPVPPPSLAQDMATFAQRLELAKTDPAVKAETDFVLEQSSRFGDKIGSGSAPDPTYTAYREWLEAGQPEGFDMFKARLRTKVNEQGKGERGRVTFTKFVGDDVSLAKHSEEATRAEQARQASLVTEPGKGPGTEPIFYRGTTTGDTRRIKEPFTAAKGKTFAARTPEGASQYGSDVEQITGKPGTRVLSDDTPEFWKVIGRKRPPNGYIGSAGKKGETLVDVVNDAIRKAEAAGYDAVSIGDADIGTVILNEGAFTRASAEAPEPELSTGTVPGEGPGTGTGDAEYMKAVESGDVATQQRLVDEAAQRAGYDTNKGQGYFHGSPDFEGNEFKREFMGRGSGVSRGAFNFTKNRAIAEAYEGQRYSDPDQVQIDDIVLKANRAFESTKLSEAQKAKLENELGYQWDTLEFDGRAVDDLGGLIESTKAIAQWMDKNGFKETAKQLKEAAATPARKGQEPRLIRAYLKAPEEFTHPRGGDIIHQVRSSEQVKSADPIVRDDQGNVIPLSQRFNPEQKDIRYMRAPAATREEMAALVAAQKTNPNPGAQARIDQLKVDTANLTHDERVAHAGTFFGKAMRLSGMSEQEMAQRLPTIAGLWTAIKELANTDLALLTEKGRQAYGLFVGGGHPLVMMSASPKSAKLMGYTVAHELIGHGLWDAHARGQLEPKVSMQLDRTRKFVTGALPEDRALMLKWMTEGLPSELRKSPELAEILRTAETVQSPDEVMAHMNALAAMHMVEGRTSNLNGLVKYLPKPLSDFLVNAAQWASKSIRTLKMAFRGNKEMWDVLAGHEEAMKDVMRAGRETEVDALRLQAFAKMQEPGGVLDITKDFNTAQDWFSTVFDTSEFDGFGTDVAKWMAGPDMYKDAMGQARNLGGAAAGFGRGIANIITHFLRPLSQMGAAKKAFTHAAALPERRDAALNRGQKSLADIMSAKILGPAIKFGDDAPVSEFYNKADAGSMKAKDDIHRWTTETAERRTKTSSEHLRDSTPEVVALFNKIDPRLQNSAKALLAQEDALARKDIELSHHEAVDFAASDTASNAIAGTNVRYENAWNFFHDWGEKVKAGPVDYAAMLAEAVPVLTSPGEAPQLGVQRATRYVDAFKDVVELAAERTAYNMANVGYTSERRLGAHRVTFTKGTGKDAVTDILTADNPKDRDQLIETLKRDGFSNVGIADEGLKVIPGERVSDYEKGLGEIQAKGRLRLQSKGFPEAQIDEILGAVDMRPELMTLEAQKDISSRHIKAKRTPGREYLDMTKQRWDWAQAKRRQNTMKVARAERRGVENDQLLKDTPEAHSLAIGFQNYETPDLPSQKKISKFGYIMSLAGSPINMAMEVVQPAVAMPAKLMDMGAMPIQANKLMANAYKQIVGRAMMSGKYFKTGELDLSKLSTDHQNLLREAEANGWLQAQNYKDFADETPTTDLFRKGAVTLGKLDPKQAQPIVDTAQAAMRLATTIHNKSTNLSTGVGLVSAYDFLRSTGKTHQQAMREVWPIVQQGLFTGGRGSRAAGVYNVGDARPVSSMMMSLQGYSVGTLVQMITYLKKGVAGQKGEKANALRAAASMITTQVLLAGVMGLPGVGAAFRILQKATGFDAEEWLEKLSDAGENPETAALVKTLSMRGISHVMGGPDISQRFGVTGLLGFNEFDGFNLANLFGPVGSYAKKGVEAVGALGRGDVGSALEAVAPVPLRKTLQLWNDDWQFQAPNNDELLVKDPSMGEKISFALGWQPVKLNRARQAWAMSTRAREAQVAKDKRVMGELADEIVDEKDVGEALKFLDARELERGPDFDRRAEAMKIAERVEKRVFVRDPGKEGTRVTGAADQAILRAMGVSAPTEEAARAQLRDNVLGALGARGYDHKALESYRQIDELRRRNPFLTVAQARAQLQRPRPDARPVPTALQALLPVQGY